jgi:hypothetical protein
VICFLVRAVRCCVLPFLCGVLLFGCTPSAILLSQGRVRVTFTGEETCGFDNPYVADAKGCRLIDKKAVMCNGFGVIDGVLFAGGCEAPARYELQETRGTLPVAPGHTEEEGAADSTNEDSSGSAATPAKP